MNETKTALKTALGHFPLPSEINTAPRANDTDALAAGVLAAALAANPGAPWLGPRQVAVHLGITDNAFTVYCRRSCHLRLWKGSYRFYTDDHEHMAILKKLIGVVLWSGIKLPAHYRPAGRGSTPSMVQ